MQIAFIFLISPESGNRILKVLLLKLLEVQTTPLQSITEASSIFQHLIFTRFFEFNILLTSFMWIISLILVECIDKSSVK